MRTPIPLAALVLAAAVTAAPVLAQAPTPDAPQAAQAGADGDALRPGDLVRVRIWREPDLSGDFAVDGDGVVVFPKLGPRPVTHASAAALRDRLVAEYGEYLAHPSIEVTLLRRLQVLGAVRSPGLYPVDGTMTITDVLALAGGATPSGDPRRVELIRGGTRVTARLDVNGRVAGSPVRSGDQIYVPERSWLSRNTGVAAALASTTVTVLLALLTR
ncbi:MAG TPA: polysaccharide biosynthesis/export family protein [Longimicrobium sp.]